MNADCKQTSKFGQDFLPNRLSRHEPPLPYNVWIQSRGRYHERDESGRQNGKVGPEADVCRGATTGGQYLESARSCGNPRAPREAPSGGDKFVTPAARHSRPLVRRRWSSLRL
jgi:hypothetical protein